MRSQDQIQKESCVFAAMSNNQVSISGLRCASSSGGCHYETGHDSPGKYFAWLSTLFEKLSRAHNPQLCTPVNSYPLYALNLVEIKVQVGVEPG